MKYFAYHYMNPRNKNNVGERDVATVNYGQGGGEFIASQFGPGGNFDSNQAGYNINQNPHFFERIDYVLYHAQKGIQYSLINPVMTGFTHTPLDYASNEVMEFSMTFQYESFTTYDQTNFNLTTVDLARFEDVSGMTNNGGFNQNFLNDGSGSIEASQQRDLLILGNENNPRERSPQPVVDKSPDSIYTTKNTVTTYATEPPRSSSTNFTKSLFGEFLGDVADKALSAAINGADVKDAALGAVFDNIAGGIQDGTIGDFLRPEKPSPPQENTETETENTPNTPGGT
jgi:hypothetical protein